MELDGRKMEITQKLAAAMVENLVQLKSKKCVCFCDGVKDNSPSATLFRRGLLHSTYLFDDDEE